MTDQVTSLNILKLFSPGEHAMCGIFNYNQFLKCIVYYFHIFIINKIVGSI